MRVALRSPCPIPVSVVLAVLLVTGCAGLSVRESEVTVRPESRATYLADKPEALHPHYEVLLRQGPRNAVLNHMRSGLAAIELEALPVATSSLDEALKGIEAIYAGTEEAAKARQVFTRESYKDFKGEPYERAMAYYYRGLLYMREGDYENARASFKGGILQDAFAEEEQNRSDFALLMFLEGWTSRCLGADGLAEESFSEVTKLKPEFAVPPRDHNTLLLAELGTAPVKYADGPGRSQLHYRRGDGFNEARAQFVVGDQVADAFPLEDIFWQASTRGGRPVDYIMAGKAHFKETAGTIGNVATVAGLAILGAAASARSSEAAIAGGVITLVGLIAKGVEAASRTEADARYWDNLPDTVHVATAALPDSEQPVNALFLDGSGTVIEGLDKVPRVTFAGRCALAWARSRTAVPADPRAPNSVAKQ